MNQVTCFSVLASVALPLFATGCSGAGQVDLGGAAGSAGAGIAGSSATAGASASSGSDDSNPLLLSAMTIQLGADHYSYSCNTSSGLYSQNWRGPAIDAIWQPDPASSCGWPRTKPRLSLYVMFTDFLPSVGLPTATYDLAEPSPQKVVVVFNATSQAEVPVGQGEPPWASYSSSPVDIMDDSTAAGPNLPASGVSGTLTLAKYGPESVSSGINDFDVSLSNVVLPMLRSADGYPSSVTIESAHLVNQN